MFCFNTFQWYIFYGWILQGHSVLVDLQVHWIVGNYKYFGVSGADDSYPQISAGMFNDFLPVSDPIWQTGEPTRSPSTKNQPFKNYRHLPIKMAAPLSKIPTPWFPPPRGASPTCCPACARWDPPLEHVGNRGEKTGENPNKSYLDNPWRKVKEALIRNGSCKRFPVGTSKWDIALCTLVVSQPLLLGCAQTSNYSKLTRLKVATV